MRLRGSSICGGDSQALALLRERGDFMGAKPRGDRVKVRLGGCGHLIDLIDREEAPVTWVPGRGDRERCTLEFVNVLLLETDGEGDVMRVRDSLDVLDPSRRRATRHAMRRGRHRRQREQRDH